jgi:hypothetical protein
MTPLKTVLLLIALIFTAVPQAQAAQTQQQIVYRNFVWGVSKEDVRQYETAVFYKEEGDSLYFLLKPDRFRRMLRYDFKDNKLAAVRFEVVEYREAISGNVVNMFYDVEKELTDLYGPGKAEAVWRNKRYQDHPDYWGRALYGGNLRLKTTWTPPGAVIEEQAYYDGIAYQLFYTIVKTSDKGADTNAIDLAPAAPAASKTPALPPVVQP